MKRTRSNPTVSSNVRKKFKVTPVKQLPISSFFSKDAKLTKQQMKKPVKKYWKEDRDFVVIMDEGDEKVEKIEIVDCVVEVVEKEVKKETIDVIKMKIDANKHLEKKSVSSPNMFWGVVNTIRKKVFPSVGKVEKVEKKYVRKKRGGRSLPCPFFKRVPDTTFIIDGFRRYEEPECNSYFLTHYHSDHYVGITKKFNRGKIYCTEITSNLLINIMGVDKKYISSVPMNTKIVVEDVQVTFYDANHCPGAAIILFVLPNGDHHLHSGDLRFDSQLQDHIELTKLPIKNLYLDTTYCKKEHDFPKQIDIIQDVIRHITNRSHHRTLFVFGSYTIGKEKLFLKTSEIFNFKIYVSPQKTAIIKCLQLPPSILSNFTSDPEEAQIHVVTMRQLSYASLEQYLKTLDSYDRIFAVRPTGWSYSAKTTTTCSLRTNGHGNVTVLQAPYSEHSSLTELQEMVQTMKPLTIIPTVDNKNSEGVNVMVNLLKSPIENK